MLWFTLDCKDFSLPEQVHLVIPFRNEERNLEALCDCLNVLDFPTTQLNVVFVNDHSEDNSVGSIEKAELQFPYEIIHLDSSQGKKAALQKAWEKIDNGIVVQTDADCLFGPQWLKSLIAPFEDKNIQLVSAPVSFRAQQGYLNSFMELEFAALIAIGASHIQWRRPMICNGANLAYRSEITSEVDLNNQFSSGEDIFLMKSISNQGRDQITFQKCKDAMVFTYAPEGLKDFIQQRLRWASKNTEYTTGNTLTLAAVWLFHVLLLFNLFTFTSIGWTLFLFQLVIKIVAEVYFYEALQDFFSLRKWRSSHLWGQFIHIPYMALTPIFSKLVKFQWKGRRSN